MEFQIGELLSSRNLTLSVAESFTAGGISSRICSVPGSSKYFLGGIVAYSIKSKIQDLNVNMKDIKAYSAVSEQVAKQMAIGVRKKYDSDFSLSTTGYASSFGDETGKVFITLSSSERTIVKEYKFDGNRKEICNQAIEEALQILFAEIKLFIYTDK